ncbi:MAG TPA: glycoside hydrolase family 3 N-terminal domain-containing protein [Ginsengibacter sp.]|nr:glycoside hydrolase family 3 N-terminal domain-containing protein [Ginsengibacter sp.]HRP16682.1 glycoside hydrolase family 3 N-terminal domain-containing protein [Ginsengibacter sp.]HRP43364.1 glycoside hydrolase family 3 N-terminal domain-containing protein [Ginsengibacter sp.]
MMKRLCIAGITFFFLLQSLSAQQKFSPKAIQWADSVFNTLNDDQRIAQLMVLRESTYSAQGPVYYDSLIREMIQKYNIGGICLFQGTPVKQAQLINEFQAMAKTPLMVAIDGEWGLGMRLDSIISLNHPMMVGATNDSLLVYQYGRLVGRQMKRIGVQVNYAPVVDINNNPANPVINDRSFGENKYNVARFGLAYMHGLQDEGIIACAKHFPGHGDVSVDSHKDLPEILKSMSQLDTLELYPFKRLIQEGVASIMIAHLYIPAIDPTPNTATSISRANVTGLLREKLKYDGLTFTDALGMKGVSKFFPGGTIAAQSLIAGNDMLCLPEDVAESIAAIRAAIDSGKLSWNDIYEKCKKVLRYKYEYGSATFKPVNLEHLTSDLNDGINALKTQIAREAITLLKDSDRDFFPLKTPDVKGRKIAYIGIGIGEANTFANALQHSLGTDNFYFSYKEDNRRLASTIELIKNRYDKVVIGLHGYNRYPANQFGISENAMEMIRGIAANNKSILFSFGNPYANQYFCNAANLVACYEDDSLTQKAAVDMLTGRIPYKGILPVTICPQYPSGSGIHTDISLLPKATPESVGMDSRKLMAIDSIVLNGIAKGAFPGSVVLAAKDGKVFYEKSFGTYNYGEADEINTQSIFDLASVTKILATTLSVMKLYDEGKIKLDKTLGTYLPWVRKSDKKNLNIEKILLHQAGLVAYIPFFKTMIDEKTGTPLPRYFRSEKSNEFSIRVAQNLYLRTDYEDSIYQRILNSKLGPQDKYIYSDNDFIFLGKIVEAISGMSLDEYTAETFYKPMGLRSTGFRPREKFDTNRIVPTEFEKTFRMQHLHGDVHDPGSALFGGIAGHAGLFSTAGDMAALLQMLLNGGTFGGKQYLKPSTINLFTAYNSAISRRGIGFDKPQKDNYTTADKDPYPSRFASPLTYGHTGYTGTCIWVDPEYNLVYVFLSNRVNPDGGTNLKLSTMNIRGEIEDSLYKAMIPTPEKVTRWELSEKQVTNQNR